MKQALECRAYLGIQWLASISKITQQAMNAEQGNVSQAMKESIDNDKYLTIKQLAQTLQKGAVANAQDTQKVSGKNSALL